MKITFREDNPYDIARQINQNGNIKGNRFAMMSKKFLRERRERKVFLMLMGTSLKLKQFITKVSCWEWWENWEKFMGKALRIFDVTSFSCRACNFLFWRGLQLCFLELATIWGLATMFWRGLQLFFLEFATNRGLSTTYSKGLQLYKDLHLCN